MAYLFEMSIFFFRWFFLLMGWRFSFGYKIRDDSVGICESTDAVTVDRL